MTNKTATVHLSAEETEYLSNLASEDNSFASLFGSQLDLSVNGGEITLSYARAETIRDYLTERLARVGFDADYKANREGRLLETLIDTFFIR